MSSIAKIQRSLEEELKILMQRQSGVREFLAAITRAAKQLGLDRGERECPPHFLSVAVLVNSYDAFVTLNGGDPGRASWLIIRSWQQCNQAAKGFSVAELDAQKLLDYQQAVCDFLDDEVRFA